MLQPQHTEYIDQYLTHVQYGVSKVVHLRQHPEPLVVQQAHGWHAQPYPCPEILRGACTRAWLCFGQNSKASRVSRMQQIGRTSAEGRRNQYHPGNAILYTYCMRACACPTGSGRHHKFRKNTCNDNRAHGEYTYARAFRTTGAPNMKYISGFYPPCP